MLKIGLKFTYFLNTPRSLMLYYNLLTLLYAYIAISFKVTTNVLQTNVTLTRYDVKFREMRGISHFMFYSLLRISRKCKYTAS